LTGRPLVYLSLGTIHHTRIDFYRTAFEAFAGHPGQFILSVGPRTSAADLGAIPANFLVRPSVPQLEVLQRADLFVTHGGMNSVHEGLYYGVPLVIVPFQMEQLFNARIVESCGAGILLGGGPPFGRVSALQLRAAVDSVLHTASYRTSAQAIRQDLIGSGGYRRAADEIEACAHQLRSREPLLD
jgi:hypothetical protein